MARRNKTPTHKQLLAKALQIRGKLKTEFAILVNSLPDHKLTGHSSTNVAQCTTWFRDELERSKQFKDDLIAICSANASLANHIVHIKSHIETKP